MNTEPVEHRTLDDDVFGVLVAGVRDGQRVLDDAADANWHTPNSPVVLVAGIASVRWTPVAAAVASAGLVTVNV